MSDYDPNDPNDPNKEDHVEKEITEDELKDIAGGGRLKNSNTFEDQENVHGGEIDGQPNCESSPGHKEPNTECTSTSCSSRACRSWSAIVGAILPA